MTPPVFQLATTALLPGTNLIEASAGTGKTFTIAGLFLRLLLEQKLSVREILVVTYTVSATGELRERIRRTLAGALRAFESGGSDVPLLHALLERFRAERQEKQALLEQALHGFDEAAIFTIHGFCQRVLKDRAFESGLLFDTELMTDPTALLREVVEDFWRRQVTAAGGIPAAFALKEFGAPEGLLPLVNSCLPHPGLEILPTNLGPERRLDALGAELIRAFAAAGAEWAGDEPNIRACFGSTAKWANRPYNRDDVMEETFRRLAACLAERDLSSTALAALEAFTRAALAKATTKRGQAVPPVRPFFAACDALAEAARQFALGLQVGALRFVETELPRRKAALKVQSFDDLLRRLDDALAGPGGDALAGILRAQFPAALIDEFQDTDPVQYRIFRRVFATPAHWLFLIGDPKQAIYGFRGADIFTYLDAAAHADHRYTLAENWRSERGLVAATNAIFLANPDAFVVPGIDFRRVEAMGAANAKPLRVAGRAEPPFQIWLARRDDGDIAKVRAEDLLSRTVAAEIARLLAADVTLGDRRLAPEDLAVLVPENRQAQLMQEALAAAGIPSVLLTTGSLFASREATEVKRVLAAVAEPASEPLLKAALATDLLGRAADDLERLTADAGSWAAVWERFRGYRDAWTGKGFIPMFRSFLQREGVRGRLLRLPEGERRLTNVLHLGEVLQQASAEERLGVGGLLKWIVEQQTAPDTPAEEHQLRLERDEQAVKLVTIHKCKGLEYPVVFCPFSWRGSGIERNRKEIVFFHDEATRRLGRDLGSDQLTAHATQARVERLAENVRLLYVALTRARHRCCFVWGGFNGADTSAPAWLLHPPAQRNPDAVAALAAQWAQLDDDRLRGDLANISAASAGGIQVSDLPEPAEIRFEPAAPAGPPLAARTFTGTLRRDWRVTSFSALTAGHDDERPDYDFAPAAPAEDAPATGIFAFPRGAKAGTCLHKIFERLDFPEWAGPALADLVAGELRAHGFSPSEFGAVVTDLIGRVMTVPLNGVTLASVPRERRLTELEFCFPLGRVAPGPLQALLARHGVFDEDRGRGDRFHFNPVTGVLKGFIDLVFEAQGRFWIVDWKSNWLGNRPEDYDPAALRGEIQRRHYFLQYQLYTVALDKYLRLRLPGYDFERHFGGVCYVFLRGVDSVRPGLGLFHDRPAAALVRELGEWLGGEKRRVG